MSVANEFYRKAPKAELLRELESLLDVQLELAQQFELIARELKFRRMRLRSIETMIREVEEILDSTIELTEVA